MGAGLFKPLAVLLGDLEILPDEAHGGNAAQADNDFGAEQRHLVAEIADAGLYLHVEGVTVLGWTAFDRIADEYPGAVQVDEGEHIVQQLTRLAHKGLAGQVLLFAGALPDEHDFGVPGPVAEHHVVPGLGQGALLTGEAGGFQFRPIKHVVSSFLFHDFLHCIIKCMDRGRCGLAKIHR